MSGFTGLDWHGVAVLAGMVAVFVVMARDRVPITVVSLSIIALLALGLQIFPYQSPRGALKPSDFFTGFGHEALIAICSLMILGRGLAVTGALEPLSRLLALLWKRSSTLAMFAVLISCILLSGILNDTPIVVLMTPVLMSLAARTGSSPAPLLMPMNFAVLIGGTATAIGTSTNLLVVSLAADLGAARFSMFDFTPLVAMAALPALLYLLIVAPRLLQRGDRVAEPTKRRFASVLRVMPGGYADGHTVSELRKRCPAVVFREIQNVARRTLARLPTTDVLAGYHLHITGSHDDLKECERLLGGSLCPDEHLEMGPPVAATQHDDLHLVQLIVSADSVYVGRRLGDLRLSTEYGLLLLAANRGSEAAASSDVRDWLVHAGDVLLVQGSTHDIEAAKADTDLLALDGVVSLPRTRKAPVAIGIMLAVVGVAATGLAPIAVAALVGAVLMLLTRCVLPRNLGRAMSAEVILLIPASLAMGKALTVTGGADWMANLFLDVAGGLPIRFVLAAVIALMSIMTNFISNNAAAVIGTPIAVAVAHELGAPPEPFALAVLLGCNLCFATPFGYQTNLIVMSAAGYRFADFIRVGLPLTLLMIVAYALILPMWYGL
ncbi:MAG: SLC13 family permease [Gammaproteobacteria bacterium]